MGTAGRPGVVRRMSETCRLIEDPASVLQEYGIDLPGRRQIPRCGRYRSSPAPDSSPQSFRRSCRRRSDELARRSSGTVGSAVGAAGAGAGRAGAAATPTVSRLRLVRKHTTAGTSLVLRQAHPGIEGIRRASSCRSTFLTFTPQVTCSLDQDSSRICISPSCHTKEFSCWGVRSRLCCVDASMN